MSQHDLTIDNQGFPAFRADLNNALQALGSTQSGTSAPSPTFANQLWYDTTNNQLKIRNEDNDAWIVLATLDQTGDVTSGVGAKTLPAGDIVGTTDTQTLSNKTITFANGSAGTPAISPASDSNTGIFFPAADTIAFAEGGTEVMRIDSSANVGIGTNSPAFKLDTIVSTGNAIAIRPTSGTTSSLQTAIRLYGHESTTTSRYIQIGCLNGSGTDVNSISFYTGFGTTITEHMRLTAGGDLQFNSGYGSLASAYGCRAWVNFNGTGTVAIRASANVSSITDNGTGAYTVNITNALPDTNYVVNGQYATASGTPGDYYVSTGPVVSTRTTSSFKTSTYEQAGFNYADSSMVMISIFR